MKSPDSRSKVQGAWRLLLALLCVSLVIACGAIQVVHVHPQGDLSHADCALCATAHVGAQIVETPPAVLHVARVVSVVEAFVPPTLPPDFFTFALFTRPPPADAHPS